MALLLCQAKGGTLGKCPQNCVSPSGGGSKKFYSNGSKRAWSALGHSFDWLVMRYVDISIINVLIPGSLGSRACGQHTVNFSHLVRVSFSANSSKIIFCVYSLRGDQGPAPRLFFSSEDSSLVSASPPFLN